MPDLLRVRTVFTGFSGAPGMMTQYFRKDAPGFVQGDAQLAVDRIRDSFVSRHGQFPVAWRWTTQSQVDQLNDANGEVSNSWSVTTSTGTGTSSQTGYGPIASGALVKWMSNSFVGGRHVIGKTYLVPIGNNSLDLDGTLSAGTALELNAWATAMLNEGTTGLHLVVWSRPREARAAGPNNRPRALTAREGSSYVITAGAINDKACVLTSRRD